MTVKERDGWLFVTLEAADRDPDLDWHGFVRWKIPEHERVYVSQIDTWIVQGRYRDLVRKLYSVYRAVSRAEVNKDTEVLQQAQRALEEIDWGYRTSDRAPTPGLQPARSAMPPGSRWRDMYTFDRN